MVTVTRALLGANAERLLRARCQQLRRTEG